MREVQWVIFDEIHYMRDKGEISHDLYSWTLLIIISPWCGLGRNHYPVAG